MSCILKRPNESDKGIVTFTTQEKLHIIDKSREIQNQISALKERFFVGLHFNWHDYNYTHNPLYDFCMAGKGDLGRSDAPLIDMDACNFIPECYTHSGLQDYEEVNANKHWDLLYVARGVSFKRLPIFFREVKRALQKEKFRTLLVCCLGDESVLESEVLGMYNQFSDEEKQYFDMVSPSHNYPFTYSSETLGYFYKSSRIFVHTASSERRCRATANSWAARIPVIARPDPASILPAHLHERPLLYAVGADDNYCEKILEALKDNRDGRPFNTVEDEEKMDEGERCFNVKYTSLIFMKKMEEMFGIVPNPLLYNFNNADIRLGFHISISVGSNKIDIPFSNFLDYLNNDKILTEIINPEITEPERHLEGIHHFLNR